MTSYERIYDAFLAKILEDEWVNWTPEEVAEDFRQILESAISWFRFPRVNLERNDEGFLEDLNNMEIQIIATYMKYEWVNRCILTWENIKPLYEERDFSQANLLDKLNQLSKQELKKAKQLEDIYYRSINFKPYPYGNLAGDNNG